MAPNRYRSIAADEAPEAIVVMDSNGEIKYANESVCALLGYAPEDLEGRSYLDLIHPDDRNASTEVFRALRSGQVEQIEVRCRLIAKNGTAVVCGMKAVQTTVDGMALLIAISRDLTAELEVERVLSDSKAFLARLVEVSPMVVFRREGPGLRLTYVSPNVEEIFGVPEGAVLGSTIEDAYARAHPDDRPKMRNQIARAAKGESVEITYRLRVAADDMRWVVSTVRPDPAAAGTGALLGYQFDITSQRRVEAELEWLAMHDPLTGLANRVKFDSDTAIHLSLSDRKGWNTALFYIDLDRFKEVNDVHGHEAGDQVLQELAVRIQTTVREGDLTARLGGDEFVILLPDVGEDATPIAERLHAALTAAVTLADTEISVGASIGIAFYPQDAETLDALRKRADDTMYAAKKSGGAYRFWHDLKERPPG